MPSSTNSEAERTPSATSPGPNRAAYLRDVLLHIEYPGYSEAQPPVERFRDAPPSTYSFWGVCIKVWEAETNPPWVWFDADGDGRMEFGPPTDRRQVVPHSEVLKWWGLPFGQMLRMQIMYLEGSSWAQLADWLCTQYDLPAT